MRANRGSLIGFAVLLLWLPLWAAPYTWSVKSAKTQLWLNEAVAIEYTCRFADEAVQYSIEFHPPQETQTYRLYRFSESETLEAGKRVNHFQMVLFPKQPGSLELAFDVLMRRTTKESIENSIIGRDNVADYDFTDAKAVLPTLRLEVRAHENALTGSFAMALDAPEPKLEAFEPFHVTLRIAGTGNLQDVKPFVAQIEGVHIFAEPAEEKLTLTPQGYRGEIIQRFALSSDKPFTMPPFRLSYFDPQTQQNKTLTTQKIDVAVAAPFKRDELLDAPEPEHTVFEWKWSYFNYFMTFIAGMLAGWALQTLRKRGKHESEQPLTAKIVAAKSERELLVLLAVEDAARFRVLIELAERERWSLGRLRSGALKQLAS